MLLKRHSLALFLLHNQNKGMVHKGHARHFIASHTLPLIWYFDTFLAVLAWIYCMFYIAKSYVKRKLSDPENQWTSTHHLDTYACHSINLRIEASLSQRSTSCLPSFSFICV